MKDSSELLARAVDRCIELERELAEERTAADALRLHVHRLTGRLKNMRRLCDWLTLNLQRCRGRVAEPFNTNDRGLSVQR